MENITVGLLVLMEARPGKEAAVERLLGWAEQQVKKEAATTAWFAFRLGPSTYGIFDVFPDDPGRQAHLQGRVAAALRQEAPELLVRPPEIQPVDVLASKLAPAAAASGR
jgi:quinol monooxygenase YgiN